MVEEDGPDLPMARIAHFDGEELATDDAVEMFETGILDLQHASIGSDFGDRFNEDNAEPELHMSAIAPGCQR